MLSDTSDLIKYVHSGGVASVLLHLVAEVPMRLWVLAYIVFFSFPSVNAAGIDNSEFFDGVYNYKDQTIGITGEAARVVWSQALDSGTKVVETDGVHRLVYRGWSCGEVTSEARLLHKSALFLSNILGLIDGKRVCFRPIFEE